MTVPAPEHKRTPTAVWTARKWESILVADIFDKCPLGARDGHFPASNSQFPRDKGSSEALHRQRRSIAEKRRIEETLVPGASVGANGAGGVATSRGVTRNRGTDSRAARPPEERRARRQAQSKPSLAEGCRALLHSVLPARNEYPPQNIFQTLWRPCSGLLAFNPNGG